MYFAKYTARVIVYKFFFLNGKIKMNEGMR